MFTYENTLTELLDVLCKDKSENEQIVILRNCMDHAVNHPWIDDDLKDCIYDNICREYDVPYKSTEDDGLADDEGCDGNY